MPAITNPIPTDIGDYVAIDNSLPSGLVWIKEVSVRGPRMVGKSAGCFKEGYYQMRFRGKKYFCHRVIHYLITKEDPSDMQVDHHRDRSNVGTNLRLATHQQNQHNRRSNHNSTSKYKGVSWYKQYNKWRVKIALNGKMKNLGYYHNELDAAHAYNIAARLLFGEYARLNELPNDYNPLLFEHRDKIIKKANQLKNS